MAELKEEQQGALETYYLFVKTFVMAVRGKTGQDKVWFKKARSFEQRKMTVSTEALTLFILEDRWEEWEFKWRKDNNDLTEEEKQAGYKPPTANYTESAQARADRLGTSKKARAARAASGRDDEEGVTVINEVGGNAECLSEEGLLRLQELHVMVGGLREEEECQQWIEADFNERLKNVKSGNKRKSSEEREEQNKRRSLLLVSLQKPSKKERERMDSVFASFTWEEVEQQEEV